jgi:hypothetical protein
MEIIRKCVRIWSRKTAAQRSVMTVSRRRLFQTLALTGGCITEVEGAESPMSLEVLRNVSSAHGINLTDDRLRIVGPVLEQGLPQLRVLRDLQIDDTVAPTQGILGK